MPRLSRWTIRAALLYLAAGFTTGAMILAAKAVPALAPAWRLRPAHIEFLMFGWTTQLILGVAFWILPRFSHGQARGVEAIAWAAVVLLNLGLWLVTLQSLGALPPAFEVAGRGCEAAAAGFMAGPHRSGSRPARPDTLFDGNG